VIGGSNLKLKYFVLGGLVLLLTVLAFNWLGICAEATKPIIETAVGNCAPDFTLTDLNGQNYRLQEVVSKSRVTLVNFWATWCGPCRKEIPELINFYKQYSKRKVALLAIDLQEKPADIKRFAQQAGMDFPVLADTTGKVGDRYKIYAIPTTLIIDQKGVIRKVIEGSTNLATLVAEVNVVMKGNKL
jgi:thiol-disulfide isomerase/thioredoxin